MNKHIRAAFFDIDGTLLLFGSHEMPDSTVQALHALQANGVKVFIATAVRRCTCRICPLCKR